MKFLKKIKHMHPYIYIELQHADKSLRKVLNRLSLHSKRAHF